VGQHQPAIPSLLEACLATIGAIATADHLTSACLTDNFHYCNCKREQPELARNPSPSCNRLCRKATVQFSEAQIAFERQAEDGSAVAEVCRKAGISEATFYNWRKKYVGLLPSEMKRLRQLEEENSKLKRIVADLSLDKAMLQDVLSKKL
jgi:putative transposase